MHGFDFCDELPYNYGTEKNFWISNPQDFRKLGQNAQKVISLRYKNNIQKRRYYC